MRKLVALLVVVYVVAAPTVRAAEPRFETVIYLKTGPLSAGG